MTSDQIQEVIGLLDDRAGSYEGITENQAGQGYRTTLKIDRLGDTEGFALTYEAGGTDGTVYYTENSSIVPGADGGLDLLFPSANIPDANPDQPVRHELRREEAADGSFKSFVFGYGEIQDRSIYRQEISIDMWENGDIGYRYAWGRPGEDFGPRSVTRMQKA
jgi:hypothetical protein